VAAFGWHKRMKAGVARLLASMLLARSAAALAAVPRRFSVAAGPSAAIAAASSAAARQSRRSLSRMMTPPPTGESAVAEAPKVVVAAPVVLPTNENSDRLLRIRHSTAHVMAMAVQRLYNDTKVTIGPWIEKGFYYDFDKKTPFEDKDLRRIKKEMDKLIGLKLPIEREEVSYAEAKARIEALGETYKLEILEDIHTRDPAASITIYQIGEAGKARWWDLCAGPHVEHTGMLPADAIELESIAGAYWRGDEKRPMLQRIYGTAWETAEQLAEYARLREEAKR
jgi:threonyl-tRNA synthetase